MTTHCSGHRRALPGLMVLAGLAFTLMCAATASAQVVNDPRIAEFDPSPDHWQSLENGESAVVRYELGMYMLGAASPFTTVDMGKPSPGADGKIRYDFASGVAGWPLTGGYYEARVSAVGPEGAALSDPSNPFTFGTASSCAISLSAASVSVPTSGGSYTIQVSTGAGCAWTAATSLSWVKMWTSGGSGSGTVPFAVQSNPTTSSRSGTITIGGRTLTIRQDGVTVSPTAYKLTVSRPSGGTVYSAGINCGTTGTACAVTMPASMSLGLQAAPAAGYAFTGWTGDCRGTYPSCTLQLDGQRSCGATFTAASATGGTSTTGGTSAPSPDSIAPSLGGPYTLTVARPSGGVVRAAGIVCGTGVTSCAVSMPGPMTIGLQATADPGYTFAGWGGHCAGSSPSYSLALEGPRSCGATFTAAR